MMEQNKKSVSRFDEEEFMTRLQYAMQQQGYDAELFQDEEMPLTLDCVFDYQGNEITLDAMFLPMEFYTGDEVQTFQLYFPLFEELEEKDYERLERVCNYCNGNISIGTFLLQRRIGVLSYKHCFVLRAKNGMQAALYSILDSLIIMRSALEHSYAGFVEAAENNRGLDEIIDAGLFPDRR